MPPESWGQVDPAALAKSLCFKNIGGSREVIFVNYTVAVASDSRDSLTKVLPADGRAVWAQGAVLVWCEWEGATTGCCVGCVWFGVLRPACPLERGYACVRTCLHACACPVRARCCRVCTARCSTG